MSLLHRTARSALRGGCLALLLAAAPAQAVDGVAEINGVCATQTGCFPGDAAGYPVTITGAAGSSYRLTSDLTFSGSDTTGILISASYTSLDLNGFRIQCSNFTPPASFEPCSESVGSGFGVAINFGLFVRGVQVRNGSIVGMGSVGLALGAESSVFGLRAIDNQAGFSLGPRSILVDSNAVSNRADGIGTSDASIVLRNRSALNGEDGIDVFLRSVVRGNESHGNGGAGIDGSSGSVVSENAVRENGTDGIAVAVDSLVHRNVTNDNAQSPLGGHEIRSSGTSAYRDNAIANPDPTSLVSGGIDAGNNLCNAAPCP